MAKNTPGVSVYLDSGKTAQVLSKFTYIGEQAMPTELKALMAGANTVVNSAKRRVPKKTGTLSRSIHMEQGTARMKGRPYLQPALTENQQRIQNQVQRAMQQMIASQGA